MPTWVPGTPIYAQPFAARNTSTSGVHGDDFARRQGFERGVVPGPAHLTFVSTALQKELGLGWLERGRLRARFSAPVYDGDVLQPIFEPHENGASFASDYRVEKQPGGVVVSGTATLDPSEAPRADAPRPSTPRDELLDLGSLSVGERLPEKPLRPGSAEVQQFCFLNHDDVTPDDLIPTSFLALLMFVPVREFFNSRSVMTGMYGEVDIQQHALIRRDHPYTFSGTVKSLRRRGDIEAIDLHLEAHDPDDRPICSIEHTHLIVHRG